MNNVFVPAVGNRDSDDLRQNSSALFPPEFYLNLLANETVKKLIGAESTYGEWSVRLLINTKVVTHDKMPVSMLLSASSRQLAMLVLTLLFFFFFLED